MLATDLNSILEKAFFSEMISADQLSQVVQAVPDDVVILDIRTEIEFAEGMLPGSVKYPFDHNLEDRSDTKPFENDFFARCKPDTLDSDKRYILVCRTGPRTEIAIEAFTEAGLEACELVGGILGWREQGLAIVDGSDRPDYTP
uniref:Rhodanese domain-containing protein n=1 Tax=Magnetococcus massalia (strain MO-1) TaxID=451514 RepID=A0A1S7LIT7_MAGMO|nr:conserved protein of unknown function [Include Rhodanese-like domain] [Candidatus Magnetococcus massalia]